MQYGSGKKINSCLEAHIINVIATQKLKSLN